METGITLDDYYGYELMELIRDETIRNNSHALSLWEKTGRQLPNKLNKSKKLLLGNLVIFDKFYAGTYLLERTLNGFYKDPAVHDELDNILIKENPEFQNLLEQNLLMNLSDLELIPQNNELPWISDNNFPDQESYYHMLSTMEEFESLFGTLLEKRKIIKSSKHFNEYIRRIEGVAFYDDSPSLIGPDRITINQCLYDYSRSLVTAMNQNIPMLTDITSVKGNSMKRYDDAKDIYQLISFVLKEVTHLPQPKSLKEAVDLRNHSLVIQFRTSIFKWMESVLTGEKNEENEARKELKNISSKFKKLNWCGTVSKYVTYLSVPALIADLALTGGFIGITGTVIGVGTQITVDNLKNRLRTKILGLK